MPLDHIGLEVNDLYTMELYYKKLLGFRTCYRYISVNTPSLRTAFLERDGFRLELLERPRNSFFIDSKLEKTGHLAIEVADVDAEYTRIKMLAPNSLKAPRDTGDGYREFSFEDPEGNTIEIARRIKPEVAYPIKAVIFDLDGTLIDSEKNYYEGDRRFLEGYGIPYPPEKHKDYMGVGNLAMIHKIKKQHGINEPDEDMLRRKNAIYMEIARQNTVVFPEMLKLLNLLTAAGYPMAIASGSSPAILQELLTSTGIIHYFKVILSADNVKRGKPAPDIFLLTAEKLGIPPENCLVFEDSQYGVEAAKRAFMQCAAVPYFLKPPLPDNFLMTDLLYPSGMDEFKAEHAMGWILERSADKKVVAV